MLFVRELPKNEHRCPFCKKKIYFAVEKKKAPEIAVEMKTEVKIKIALKKK
jgi:hypothetical protein